MSITLQPHFTQQEIVDMITPFVGETFTTEIVEAIKAKTLRPVRPFGTGFISTMDYRHDRINLVVDDHKVIRGVHFG